MNSVEALTNLSTHQKLWLSFVYFLCPHFLGLWSKMQFPSSSSRQSAFILRTPRWESQNDSKHTRTSSRGHQTIGKTVYCRIEHLPISINCHQPHIFRHRFPSFFPVTLRFEWWSLLKGSSFQSSVVLLTAAQFTSTRSKPWPSLFFVWCLVTIQ